MLAELLLDQLSEAANKADFDQMVTANSDTRSLDQIYGRPLQQLNEQEENDSRLGNRVLKEMLAADQLLSAEELLDAVADDGQWQVGDRNNVDARTQRCLQCCSGLVICNRKGKFRFVHRSARQFLRRNGFPKQEQSTEAVESTATSDV